MLYWKFYLEIFHFNFIPEIASLFSYNFLWFLWISSFTEILFITFLRFEPTWKITQHVSWPKTICWRNLVGNPFNVSFFLALCPQITVFFFFLSLLFLYFLEDIVFDEGSKKIECAADQPLHFFRSTHASSLIEFSPLSFKSIIEVLKIIVFNDNFFTHTKTEFRIDLPEIFEKNNLFILVDFKW